MFKTILGLVIVFVIVLSGIFIWHTVETNRIKSRMSEIEKEVADRRKVMIDIAVAPPANTPKEHVLYVSGSVPSLGNWDAAGVPLKPGDDGKQHAKVEVLTGLEYAFKVTRGTWGTVEADPNGKDIPNRTFTAASDNQTIPVNVANWLDGGKAVPGRVTTTGDIRLHKKFHSDLLNNERTLAVYCPPDYEKSKDQRYPVLYMQDGQNLFDESTSYQGIEWRMDEAAEELIKGGKIAPLIIVAMFNSEQRSAEFTPPALAAAGAQASGDQYAKFVVNEVKPFIDSRYRTRTDRSATGIGGSSMGALIAMHVAKQNPTTFGQMVLMSPWLRLNKKQLAGDWVGDGKWLKGTKLYVEMGSNTLDNYPGDSAAAASDAQELVAALEKAGLTACADFQFRTIEGGTHNESGWQHTVPQPLLFLYGKPAVATTQ